MRKLVSDSSKNKALIKNLIVHSCTHTKTHKYCTVIFFSLKDDKVVSTNSTQKNRICLSTGTLRSLDKVKSPSAMKIHSPTSYYPECFNSVFLFFPGNEVIIWVHF